MTALRSYERDQGLPARLGDAGLTLPGDDELAALVAGELAPADVAVQAVELVHARWKPGVALVGLYRVELQRSGWRWVGFKRHVGGKGARIAAEFQPEARAAEQAAPLRASAPLPSGDGHLWTFPADRELRGAQRAFDLTRFARRFDASRVAAGWTLRKRASRLDVLRYKPERRVVARLDARLRGADDSRAAAVYGLRLLPAPLAAGVVEARRRLEASLRGEPELVPQLLDFDERDGLLVEQWLVGSGHAPNEFTHASEAGRALARLHGAPLDGGVATASPPDANAPSGLDVLQRIPGAAARAQRVLSRSAGPAGSARHTFVHGDLHPDQVLSTVEGPRLLDLDTLHTGHPEADLASWIADQLVESPTMTYTAAASDLIRAYVADGGRLDGQRLGAEVAAALTARASAALRRLEVGAEERVDTLLARAARVAAGEDAP